MVVGAQPTETSRAVGPRPLGTRVGQVPPVAGGCYWVGYASGGMAPGQQVPG